jgi:hypothetical protein
MKTSLRNISFTIILILFGGIYQSSIQAQVLGRAFGGAMGGAILGALVGGEEGAQAGAVIGGAVGLAKGAQEKSQMEAQREARARQQAEHKKIEKEQQLAEIEHLKKQESTAEKVETGTVLEIQKSLIRMGYDPGDINGKAQPATENAIRLYEQKHNLLETGRPSQELLKHMLRNGG